MSDSKKFNVIATVILGILVVVTMVPILMIVIASFTEEKTLLRDGYSLLPGACLLYTSRSLCLRRLRGFRQEGRRRQGRL